MKNRNLTGNEQLLRDIYLHQSCDFIPSGWENSVMSRIRETAISDVPEMLKNKIAFELAWLAAAVAAFAVIFGVFMGPKNVDLAWRISKDSALSSWALSSER